MGACIWRSESSDWSGVVASDGVDDQLGCGGSGQCRRGGGKEGWRGGGGRRAAVEGEGGRRWRGGRCEGKVGGVGVVVAVGGLAVVVVASSVVGKAKGWVVVRMRRMAGGRGGLGRRRRAAEWVVDGKALIAGPPNAVVDDPKGWLS